jgi:hypothetical protein
MPQAKKPAARKAKARKASSSSATKTRARKATASKRSRRGSANSHRTIGSLAKSLEAAQRELSGLGGSMGEGGNDLRKDIERLLRDASRGLGKLSTSVRREAERLQKARPGARGAKPKAKRAGAKPKAKRATAKRATAKRATAKRATAKRATAKRATAKSRA